MEMIKDGERLEKAEDERTLLRATAGEYLTYRVGDEEYGVDIQRVQEIRSYEAPTRVPGAAHFVRGVMNLRGVIVPIVDMRMKLGCAQAQYAPSTVVIVMAVLHRVVGVVVDSVSDVINLDKGAIRNPPELSESSAAFITGIASVEQRMLLLVDMDSLLADTLGELGNVN